MASSQASVREGLKSLRTEIRRSEIRRGVWKWCLYMLGVGLGLLVSDHLLSFSDFVRTVLLTFFLILSGFFMFRWVILPWKKKRTYRGMIRELEKAHSLQGELLLDAYQQERENPHEINESALIELEAIDRGRVLHQGSEKLLLHGLGILCLLGIGYGFIWNKYAENAALRYLSPMAGIAPISLWNMEVIEGEQVIPVGGDVRILVGFSNSKQDHLWPENERPVIQVGDIAVGEMVRAEPVEPFTVCFEWLMTEVQESTEFRVIHSLVPLPGKVKVSVTKVLEIEETADESDLFMEPSEEIMSRTSDQLPEVGLESFARTDVFSGERLMLLLEAVDDLGLQEISLWIKAMDEEDAAPRRLKRWEGNGVREWAQPTSIVFHLTDYPEGDYAVYADVMDLRGEKGRSRSEIVVVSVNPLNTEDGIWEGEHGLDIAAQEKMWHQTRATLAELRSPPSAGTLAEYEGQGAIIGLIEAQRSVRFGSNLERSQSEVMRALKEGNAALLEGAEVHAEARLVAIGKGAELHFKNFFGRFLKLNVKALQEVAQPLKIHEMLVFGDGGHPLAGISLQHWKCAEGSLPFRDMADLVSLSNRDFILLEKAAAAGKSLFAKGGNGPTVIPSLISPSPARVYLSREIFVDTETKLTAEIGGEGTLRLWLNGSLVEQWPVPVGTKELQDLPLVLKPGKNHLILEVGNRGEGGDFLLRLLAGNRYLNVDAEGLLYGCRLPVMVASSGNFATTGMMLDGDLETAWTTKVAQEHRILIDLGAERRLSKLVMLTGRNRVIDISASSLDEYDPVDKVRSSLKRAAVWQAVSLDLLAMEKMHGKYQRKASYSGVVNHLREIAGEEMEAGVDHSGRIIRQAEAAYLLGAHREFGGEFLYKRAKKWVEADPDHPSFLALVEEVFNHSSF